MDLCYSYLCTVGKGGPSAVELDGDQGTLVLDCGLEQTRILKSSAMLTDLVGAYKVILALRDEVCAIGFRDLAKMGLKLKKRKQPSGCGF